MRILFASKYCKYSRKFIDTLLLDAALASTVNVVYVDKNAQKVRPLIIRQIEAELGMRIKSVPTLYIHEDVICLLAGEEAFNWLDANLTPAKPRRVAQLPVSGPQPVDPVATRSGATFDCGGDANYDPQIACEQMEVCARVKEEDIQAAEDQRKQEAEMFRNMMKAEQDIPLHCCQDE